jgi:hypothetical protein
VAIDPRLVTRAQADDARRHRAQVGANGVAAHRGVDHHVKADRCSEQAFSQRDHRNACCRAPALFDTLHFCNMACGYALQHGLPVEQRVREGHAATRMR